MTGAQIHELARAADGSALALSELRVSPGDEQRIMDSERDSLLFTFAGSGSLTLGAETRPVGAGTAGLVLAGEEARLEADSTALAVICATIGPASDRHAPIGAREV